MDADLYDEFGNYLGPELEESDIEDEIDDFGIPDDGNLDFEEENQEGAMVTQESSSVSSNYSSIPAENRIVLHEDKKYYPDAEEVYPGVKTMYLDEDSQELNEPIIKPIKTKNFSVLVKEIPKLKYSSEFLTVLMHTPNLIRNVAVIGSLHHGKTSFLDILVQATQETEWDPSKQMRFTDTRIDEQQRELSIKSTLASLVLENIKGKSYLFNFLDCPGHVNFSDESTAAMRAVDGAVLVVDAVEGVMLNTERLIKQALRDRVPFVVLINKMDRLILELKLPPQDAYHKLVHTIEEINKLISTHLSDSNNNSSSSSTFGSDHHQQQQHHLPPHPQSRISPELGNVCFSSSQHGWVFTLESFSFLYAKKFPEGAIDPGAFAKRLWGDWYHDVENGIFTKKKPFKDATRTFVLYILEPLYKLYSQVIGESPEDLQLILRRLGINLKKKQLHMDARPLMKLVMSSYFGYPRGFVEMLVKKIPSPADGADMKISTIYTGYQSSEIAQTMRECRSASFPTLSPTTPSSTSSSSPSSTSIPLMANVVKLYNTPDGNKFHALARIYSGSIKKGQQLRVLGEGFSLEDDEDMATAEVTSISVGVGRFSIEVDTAIAGNLVLLEGIDAVIKKTATLTDMELEDVAIFKPLKFDNASVFKVAVEPLIPSELPKMVESLRRINKSYPLATTKVEESGEHVILGTGELYMDCILHDLRHLYAEIEVKVSDPVVSFCETVVETSSITCSAETTNKKNRFSFIAEPLEDGLSKDIEKETVSIRWDKKTISDFFTNKYDWDLLAARNIWAFGPDDCSPNILLDDTLPSEVNKKLLSTVKENLIQGFKWGCREGPLCDEPIRNVKFKILDATLASELIYRGGGQIIPTARRSVYSSFLLGQPRLMEPIYKLEIQCPADCVGALTPVLSRRRGHVFRDVPKPGAPFYSVTAFLPVMDSVGFETDLRSFTQGQAFCQQVFDHWQIVPGDPLDMDVILHPLEPSPPLALARDFMIKTRRRKGLAEEVNIRKYCDEGMLKQLSQSEAGLRSAMEEDDMEED